MSKARGNGATFLLGGYPMDGLAKSLMWTSIKYEIRDFSLLVGLLVFVGSITYQMNRAAAMYMEAEGSRASIEQKLRNAGLKLPCEK